jgi:hypothetical protein
MEQVNSNTISIIYSNLQRAAEKQQRYELMETFKKLSDKFRVDSKEQGSLSDLYKKFPPILKRLCPNQMKCLSLTMTEGGKEL